MARPARRSTSRAPFRPPPPRQPERRPGTFVRSLSSRLLFPRPLFPSRSLARVRSCLASSRHVSSRARHERALPRYLRPSPSSFILSGRVGGTKRGYSGGHRRSIADCLPSPFDFFRRPHDVPSLAFGLPSSRLSRITDDTFSRGGKNMRFYDDDPRASTKVERGVDRAEAPGKARFYQKSYRTAIKPSRRDVVVIVERVFQRRSRSRRVKVERAALINGCKRRPIGISARGKSRRQSPRGRGLRKRASPSRLTMRSFPRCDARAILLRFYAAFTRPPATRWIRARARSYSRRNNARARA